MEGDRSVNRLSEQDKGSVRVEVSIQLVSAQRTLLGSVPVSIHLVCNHSAHVV